MFKEETIQFDRGALTITKAAMRTLLFRRWVYFWISSPAVVLVWQQNIQDQRDLEEEFVRSKFVEKIPITPRYFSSLRVSDENRSLLAEFSSLTVMLTFTSLIEGSSENVSWILDHNRDGLVLSGGIKGRV